MEGWSEGENGGRSQLGRGVLRSYLDSTQMEAHFAAAKILTGSLKAASFGKSPLPVLPVHSKESFPLPLQHFVALFIDLSHYKAI